jgi:hypothetical protein
VVFAQRQGNRAVGVVGGAFPPQVWLRAAVGIAAVTGDDR